MIRAALLSLLLAGAGCCPVIYRDGRYVTRSCDPEVQRRARIVDQQFAPRLSQTISGCKQDQRMTEAQPARRVDFGGGVAFNFPATSPRPYCWDAQDTAAVALLGAVLLVPTAAILGKP